MDPIYTLASFCTLTVFFWFPGWLFWNFGSFIYVLLHGFYVIAARSYFQIIFCISAPLCDAASCDNFDDIAIYSLFVVLK